MSNSLQDRLEKYFIISKKHIEKILNTKKTTKDLFPLDIDTLKNLSETKQDKIDVLIFRFSKLQDLLGKKIFKNILEYSGFNTNISFLEILSELDKESLINIDTWLELRDIRNAIAHEYPEEEETVVNELNFIYENVDYLISITHKLEEYFNEIKAKRDRNN